LGAARGEVDLVGLGAETSGHALAGLVERGARLTPPAVRAGWIAEAGAVERLHRLAHLRAHRGGGGVVEVNGGRHDLKLTRFDPPRLGCPGPPLGGWAPPAACPPASEVRQTAGSARPV